MNEHIEDERGDSEPAADRRSLASMPGRAGTAVVAGLLVVVGFAVYANSFAGVFLLDDYRALVDNPHVRHGWPTTRWHWTQRPLTNMTLSTNYALGGLDVWGYHFVNVALHVLASLALFGVVRRTLRLPRLAGRLGAAATPLAAAVALIWTVHPLHTGAVSYVIQRSEVLMALFFLLTLYCAIRAFTAEWPGRWVAAALLSAAAGAASKEVMVVVPLVVLLYDAAFVEGTFRDAIKRRWKFHAALAATTWLLAGLLVWSIGTPQRAGFDLPGLSPGRYAVTQLGVILRYLGLTFWPAGQCLDHGLAAAAGLWQIIPAGIGVAVLLGLTVWAICHYPAWGFLGAWFFLLLAPTSSVLPLADVMLESRMYLSLAGVTAAIVVGAYLLARRYAPRVVPILAAAAVALAGALATLTVMRNHVYRDDVRMYQDIVDKNADSARAHRYLGVAYARPDEQGQVPNLDKALRHLKKSWELDPSSPEVHLGLATVLRRKGDREGAIGHLRESIKLRSGNVVALTALGELLVETKKPDDAINVLRQALQADPTHAGAHLALGRLLAVGDPAGAMDHLEKALKYDDGLADAHFHIAMLLLKQGKRDLAIERLQKALEIDPKHVPSLRGLARAMSALGKEKEAIGHYRAILAVNSQDVTAANNLAWRLATSPDPGLRNGAEAVKLAEAACTATQDQNMAFLDTLAAAYAETGQFRLAQVTMQQAIDLAFKANNAVAAQAFQARLDLFRQKKPFHRQPPP